MMLVAIAVSSAFLVHLEPVAVFERLSAGRAWWMLVVSVGSLGLRVVEQLIAKDAFQLV